MGDHERQEQPVDGAVSIVLTLRLCEGGYSLKVEHDPRLFTDTVIDACKRAAAFYERRALVEELMRMSQAAMQAEQLRHMVLTAEKGRIIQ